MGISSNETFEKLFELVLVKKKETQWILSCSSRMHVNSSQRQSMNSKCCKLNLTVTRVITTGTYPPRVKIYCLGPCQAVPNESRKNGLRKMVPGKNGPRKIGPGKLRNEKSWGGCRASWCVCVCVECWDVINLWKPKTRQQIFLDYFSVLQFGTYVGSWRKRQTLFYVCSGINL